MLIKENSSESGHFYQIDGSPAYTIIGKSTGKLRNTTVRDARTMGLLPSVTTVIGVAAKPGLQRWFQEQAILAALTLPRLDGEPEDQYLSRVLDDSKAQGKEAAERGTRIHGIIESFFEGILLEQIPTYCRAIESVLDNHYGNRLWTPERSFGDKRGFGGKVDLSCRSDDITGFPGAIVDFKTTEKDLDKVDIYFEHQMQAAAYREGLGMPNANCAIVYVNALTDQVKLIEIAQPDLQKGWDCFVHLLEFYRIKNKLV